ncbi:MAG: pilus assembly protein PilP [Proteobacteria bacterium]|nr:pilus assembly protein PilP [Pseudomonadota bacterium]
MQDLQTFVQNAGRTMKGQVTPLPAFQLQKSYGYTAKDLRDPFKPKRFSSKIQGQGPNLGRPKQPLEMYPLSSLSFIGTLEMNGHRQALIHTPDGHVITVTQGQYMGEDFGRITAIHKRSIDLHEKVLNDKGTWITRDTQVVLQGKSK